MYILSFRLFSGVVSYVKMFVFAFHDKSMRLLFHLEFMNCMDGN